MERKIDFGFTFVPFPQKDIDYLKIAKVPLGSFCKKGAFRDIERVAVPYVIPSSELHDNPLSFRSRDGWNRDIPRLTPYKTNSLAAAMNLVQAGIAAIYIPKFVASSLNESLHPDRRLVELSPARGQAAGETTWRDIFLVKIGDETREMKRAAKVLRIRLNNLG